MTTHLPAGQYHFKKIREIGRGGFGTVDEIELIDSNCEHRVGSRFAVKRLNAQWDQDPTARARFEREILALKRMSHANIVSCKGENIVGEARFYMMPLYASNLRVRLAAQLNGFAPGEVAQFGALLADALSHAHAMTFVHRDLKPENILFGTNNEPVIADWGLGYFLHKESRVLQNLTRGGMGTEHYCSLEQWNTGKCGPTGDVYSLGMTLAELLTGRQYPLRLVGMGIEQDVLPPTTQGHSLFNGVLRSMTSFLPARRHQTMQHVAETLRAVARLCTQAA